MPTTESLKSVTGNTLGRIKVGESDQLEKHSNASNGFGNGDIEGENSDDKKHCKALSWVPINNTER